MLIIKKHIAFVNSFLKNFFFKRNNKTPAL